MDCEMVGVASTTEGVIENVLCKVSLVTLAPGGYGFRTLLNTWVKVEEEVLDYRTAITGLDEEIAQKLPMLPFEQAREMVANLVAGKVVVGHALENDFKALKYSHPDCLVRDTSTQSFLLPPGRITVPSLRLLAKYWLNEDMHLGVHDSVKDATTALQLYLLHAMEWEFYLQSCVGTVTGSWVPWPGRKRAVVKSFFDEEWKDVGKQEIDTVPELQLSREANSQPTLAESPISHRSPAPAPSPAVPDVTRASATMGVASCLEDVLSELLKAAATLYLSLATFPMLSCLQVVLIAIAGVCASLAICNTWQSSQHRKELAFQAFVFELAFCIFRMVLAFRIGWGLAGAAICTDLRGKVSVVFGVRRGIQ
jgi:RNA exonuclease 4